MELRRRRRLRHPARPRRQPADVPHRQGHAGAHLAGRRCSTAAASTRARSPAYDSPIYIADAARVPDGDQARPRHQEPLRPRRQAVRGGHRPAQGSRTPNVGEYWSDYLKEITGLQDRRLGGRHHVAGHRQPRAGGEGAGRGGAAEEGATGWSDTWMVGDQEQAQDLRLQVAGLHHQPRRSTPQVAEWFGEAPVEREGLRRDRRQGLLRRPSTPTTRPTSTRSGTGPRRSSSASTAAPTSSARTTATGRRRGRRSRAEPHADGGDRGRPRHASAAAVGVSGRPAPAPAAAAGRAARPADCLARWSPTSARCASCCCSSFWTTDTFTGEVVTTWTTENFHASSPPTSTGP